MTGLQKKRQFSASLGLSGSIWFLLLSGMSGCSLMAPRVDLATLTTAAEIERRGDEFFQDGNFSAASARYEEAANLVSSDRIVRRKLADTYWAENNYQAAISSMRAAIDLADPVYDRDLRQQWLVRLGEMFLELGRPGEALTAVNKAIAENPQMLAARILRSNIFEQVHSYSAALQDYHYALSLMSAESSADRVRLEIAVAGIYSQQRRANRVLSITAAMDTRELEFGQAIKVHLIRAIALRDRGRYPAAVRELEDLLTLDKADPQAYFILATTYWQQGDFPRAQQAVSRALELSPQHPGALRLQQDITIHWQS